MLPESELQAASDLLVGSWQEGRVIPALPDDLRPASRVEGYAIQALLERHSGRPPYGWKIAATSREGQAHIAVDGPLAGRLLAERAFESGAERPLGTNRMRVAEPEFAFRMGRDLGPRETAFAMGEVLAAVDSLHPAIELPDSRFEDFTKAGAAQLIADDACAHEFVLGPAAGSAWRALDLARHRVTGSIEKVHAGNRADDPATIAVDQQIPARTLKHLGLSFSCVT